MFFNGSRSLIVVALLSTWLDCRGADGQQPVTVRIPADDGFPLAGDYYGAAGSRPAPVALFFHQCGRERDRTGYGVVASLLARSGIHALTVDQRGYGESRGPGWDMASGDVPARTQTILERFSRDAEAVYRFVIGREEVDTGRVAVVGASCGIVPAGQLAQDHMTVKALVVLSSAPRPSSGDVVAARSQLAVLGIGADDDSLPEGSRSARRTQGQLVRAFVGRSANPRSTAWTPAAGGHGTEMFARHPEMEADLVVWLREALGVSASDFHPRWSPAGSEIVFDSNRDGYRKLFAIDPSGRLATRLTHGPYHDSHPAWSPDAQWLVFESSRSGDTELYVMRRDGTELHRLTDSPGLDGVGAWSPDGTQLAFTSFRHGNADVFRIDRDGGRLRRLTDHPGNDNAVVWSPDGSQISFHSDRAGNYDIYVMSPDGGAVTQLTDHPGRDLLATWSRDGERIAFFSDRSGQSELYTMRTDGSGVTQITTNAPGTGLPSWSPDGSRITFFSVRDGNAEIYVMNADGTGQKRLTAW